MATMTSGYSQLLEGLHEVRRQWRARQVLEGTLLAVAGILGALGALALLDNFVRLSPAGRGVAGLVIYGVAAVLILRCIVRRVLADRRDDFFAALVEERHPELHNYVINALQLGRGDSFGSPRLVQSIVEDAIVKTSELDLADALSFQEVKRALLLALGVVLGAGLYLAVSPDYFLNGVQRVLFFRSAIAPYSATRVEVVTPAKSRALTLEGGPITIEARASGKVPDRAFLVYRAKRGGGWRTTRMDAQGQDDQGQGRFIYQIPAAAESFEYYVRAGDGESAPYRVVDVVAKPGVERLDVTYTFPKYTGLADRREAMANGDLRGLKTTVARLAFTTNKPLHEIALVTDTSRRVPLQEQGDPRHWQGSLAIDANGSYQVEMYDTDGFKNPEPVQHAITLVRDLAPTVAITAPGRDLQARPGSRIPLVLEAKDDFGLARLRIVYRVNNSPEIMPLKSWTYPARPVLSAGAKTTFDLAAVRSRPGDLVQYWAIATDRNDVTGPGEGTSRRFSIFVLTPEQSAARLEQQIGDFAQVLEELVRLQRDNRAQTASRVGFPKLIEQQAFIRTKTGQLAVAMRHEAMPAKTMIATLETLAAGPMVEVIHLFESGNTAATAEMANTHRRTTLPIQDQIIEQLTELLKRLQRAEKARDRLKKMAKTDPAGEKKLVQELAKMAKGLNEFRNDQKELTEKLEKLPKKKVDEFNKEDAEKLKDILAAEQKWAKWTKGSIDELTKMASGFVDDFGMRDDANRIYEEIEKVENKGKAAKIEVSLEDGGAGLATKMDEDLELWMPNQVDKVQWVMEEPLKGLKVPEMKLPDQLEDMIGDLLEKEDEFDEQADDVTSAWGDNMNQAGWDVSDGPISSFSAKGKTGNDLPNNNQLTGRSGDGRRGKSSGQMVGDTARNLEGRKTPARLDAERYEPGHLKEEGHADPKGATGGGKKTGSGRRGLQGGTPPDFQKDMGRLSAQQAGLREKAERVAEQLETIGAPSARLRRSIQLMRAEEKDLRDLRYTDAAHQRKAAVKALHAARAELDQGTAVHLSRARQLPPELREEMIQSAEEGYPEGYEAMVKSYYRALSEADTKDEGSQ